jgi:redox-sensitive bicupin YhaK (pirin superfamily)
VFFPFIKCIMLQDCASGFAQGSGSLEKVSQETLFVSEPNPRWFGNEGNTPNKAGWTNENWLKSRFHFNFAEYSHGPDSFGVLRVMNDDLVQPDRGFGMHPHRDMEILTFIVEGDLTHQDSRGNRETLGRGSIQFMTAGTGIQHSEHNFVTDRHLRFVQCWVVPRSRGLRPNYGSMVGDEQAAAFRRDQWAHVVSDADRPDGAPVRIHQDCNVFVLELSPGALAPPLEIKDGRQSYILFVEGSVSIGSEAFRRHDAAKVRGPLSLGFQAGAAGAMVLVFEMARS